MNNIELAEETLQKMLEAASISKKPTYSPGQVCLILGICPRTFWRYVAAYERDKKGNPKERCSLDSYKLKTERRVTYHELVSFLARNNNYERTYGVEPD